MRLCPIPWRPPRPFLGQRSLRQRFLDGEDAVVGHIRIKPNAVAWCPKGKHKWHQVSLARFATIAAKKGDQKAK